MVGMTSVVEPKPQEPQRFALAEPEPDFENAAFNIERAGFYTIFLLFKKLFLSVSGTGTKTFPKSEPEPEMH